MGNKKFWKLVSCRTIAFVITCIIVIAMMSLGITLAAIGFGYKDYVSGYIGIVLAMAGWMIVVLIYTLVFGHADTIANAKSK